MKRLRTPRLSPDLLGEPAKVHVGAGSRTIEGWVDTDVGAQNDVRLNLLRPWPVQDGTVDFVYGDNVIEHFPLEDARIVLRYICAALSARGMLRLATPDVERTAQAYLSGGPRRDAIMRRHRAAGYSMEHDVDVLRVVFNESDHHLGYPFDWTSLKAELERAGFSNVKRCRVGESDHSELHGLEARATEEDEEWTLVVEAEAGG